MPIHNWRQAMVRFIIELGDHLENILNNDSYTESVTGSMR